MGLGREDEEWDEKDELMQELNHTQKAKSETDSSWGGMACWWGLGADRGGGGWRG